jgi:hypothetical protein
MITSTNHMSPTNKEGSLVMFHNRKKVDHHSNPSQNRGRTIQLKDMSTWEMNTMTEQTWVITKALT